MRERDRQSTKGITGREGGGREIIRKIKGKRDRKEEKKLRRKRKMYREKHREYA